MMLRTMLAERFGLVLKSEVKERTGYVLTNSAGESKLKPWDAGRTVKDPDTGKEQASGCGMRSIPDQDGQRVSGDINCWNVPMSSFINSLAFLVSRPVLDQTNLDGMYEYNLKFAHPDYTGTSPSAFPSLPTAVREQLGLRLENSKAPVEVLVIGRVEKPTEN
jgi:uncharacterized protein (TIGR03435 family)